MAENVKEPNPKDVGDMVQLVSAITAEHTEDNTNNVMLVAYAVLMTAVARNLGLPHSELHEVIDYVDRAYSIESVDHAQPIRGN